MANLQQIEAYFEKADLSAMTALQIAPGVTVIDARRFIDSHVAILKKNKGDRAFMNVFTRLLNFYNLHKSNDTRQGVLFKV